MKSCLSFFLFLHFLQQVRTSSVGPVDPDSLCVHVIVSSGFNLPKYTQRTTLNDVTIFHHSSDLRSKWPCPDWITTTAGKEHWLTIQVWADYNKDIFTLGFESAVQQFNQSGSLSDHNIYQGMGCCHIYPNGTYKSSLTHSFNGRDFISLDIDREEYIAAVPQAVVFKLGRDTDAVFRDREILAGYYRKRCLERLNIMKNAPGVRIRKVPEIRIFNQQRLSSVMVTCHVTGFYPRAVQVDWFGPNLQPVEDSFTEVLPNEDGTYQTRKSVIVPEEHVGKHTYSCVVLHSSVPGNITRVWSNHDFILKKHIRIAVGIAVSIVFLLVIGCFVWRCCRRNSAAN